MATLGLPSGASVALEIALTRGARRRGLLGRESVDGGALLIAPCRGVHTFGMRFAIDVAHLSRSAKVLRVRTMRPGRLGAFVWRASSVLEADAGALASWGVSVGDVLEIRP